MRLGWLREDILKVRDFGDTCYSFRRKGEKGKTTRVRR